MGRNARTAASEKLGLASTEQKRAALNAMADAYSQGHSMPSLPANSP
jgi:gamma-glutamyl phosphate reductase